MVAHARAIEFTDTIAVAESYRQGLFAASFLDRFSESVVGQKLSALQSLVRLWRRLSREVELNGHATVGMTITGDNRSRPWWKCWKSGVSQTQYVRNI
jgi:hypothetical protein